MARTDLGRAIMVLRGEYSAVAPYEKLDVVKYGNSSYVALRDTIGHAPNDANYWMQLAYVDTAIAAANTATGSANAATTAATNAAAAANTAAEQMTNANVSVTMLAPSATPTGEITKSGSDMQIALGVPRSNLAYATFEVDDNAELIMYAPEGYGGIGFAINDDGYLEVII